MAFTHEDSEPIIARLITDMNRDLGRWAESNEIAWALLEDKEGKALIRRAQAADGSDNADETAWELVDSWGQRLASQKNSFSGKFQQTICEPSRFWFPEGRPLTFGSTAAHVGVNGWFVPAVAAQVNWDGSRHLLERKAWWVPVRVNDVPVAEPHPLRHNDRLTIGESHFRYEGEK